MLHMLRKVHWYWTADWVGPTTTRDALKKREISWSCQELNHNSLDIQPVVHLLYQLFCPVACFSPVGKQWKSLYYVQPLCRYAHSFLLWRKLQHCCLCITVLVGVTYYKIWNAKSSSFHDGQYMGYGGDDYWRFFF